MERPHIGYLDYLYYVILKQSHDFELQQQNKEGFMSRRKKYSEVGFDKNYWSNYANARTILPNEVCFDFDPENGESMSLFRHRVNLTIKKMLKECSPDYWGVFPTGSRGVHVHFFYKKLLYQPYPKRVQFRKKLLRRYGAEMLKSSERVTINLEWSNHWKTGNMKIMKEGNLWKQ